MVFMRKLLWLLLPLVLVVNIGAKLHGNGGYIGFTPIIELVKQFPTPEKTLESIQDFKESLEVFKVETENEPETFVEFLEQIASIGKLILSLLYNVINFVIAILQDLVSIIAYVVGALDFTTIY